MRIVALVLTALLTLASASARSADDCAAPLDLHDGWTISDPATQGLDPALICAIGPRFAAWTAANAHAVLVIRHGALVFERYYTGQDERWGAPLGRVTFGPGVKHDLRSISKSVVSLLIGIARDRGLIPSIDVPIWTYFPDYADLRTAEKDKITLRHLLTMSAGFEWNENVPYQNPQNSEVRMIGAADEVRFVLEQPLVTAPGAAYNYSGGATALLGAILAKVGGKRLDQLANDWLFAPLGITDYEWIANDHDIPSAASGLRLRARDLAKIGQLVLAKGVWQGRQIVTADWIVQATSPQIQGEGLFFYGFQWWLGRTLINRREIDWAAGVGWGGQRLFVVPDQDLVVVVFAGLYRGQIFQGLVGGTILNDFVLATATK